METIIVGTNNYIVLIIKLKNLQPTPIHRRCRHTSITDVGEACVKVNFTLEQAMKAQRGSRGIALLFL
jgi:hypothetical protein